MTRFNGFSTRLNKNLTCLQVPICNTGALASGLRRKIKWLANYSSSLGKKALYLAHTLKPTFIISRAYEQSMRLMWESWCECHLILKTSPCVSVSEKAIKAVDCFLSKGYIS